MADGGMTKGKFETVRELLKLGRLSEARAILETIDTPKAHEWLRKIAEIQRQQLYQTDAQPQVVKKRQRDYAPATYTRVNWTIGAMVIGVFLIAAVIIVALRQTTPGLTLPPTPTEPPPTLFQLPAIEMTDTPTVTPIIVTALPTRTPTVTTAATTGPTSTATPDSTPAIHLSGTPTLDWSQALQGQFSACDDQAGNVCPVEHTAPLSRAEQPPNP